jgi:hypothetical protein
VPNPAIVTVDPLIDATDVVADEYIQSPGVLDVGVVKEKLAAPYVLLTLAKLLKVGVALPTVIAVDVEDAAK